jgi:anti-sigma regulatory factor (Ser/Thr protein kinase)
MTTYPGRQPAIAASQPPPVVFEFDEVTTLRHILHAQAGRCGLSEPTRDAFVLAVNELATNAVIHGGGRGQLRLWCDNTHLHCQIRDHGPGLPITDVTTDRPPLSARGGRGLWIAARLCHLDILDDLHPGAVVEVSIPHPPHDAEHRSGQPPARPDPLLCQRCQPPEPATAPPPDQ